MADTHQSNSGVTTKVAAPSAFTMAEDIEKTDGAASAPAQPSGPMSLPDDDSEQRFQPKSFKFWSIIISIFLALFLVALDRTIIGTATPQITQEFHSLGDIGWYGSAYQLTTAASQLLFGRVYKFYEIKRTFIITVVLFEIGSAICGAAPNSIVFIVGRAIAGLGGAGIFSGVTIIMITMVPLRKRPMFQGLFGTIFGLASVLGPLVGGALTDAVTWRYPHPPATIWEQIRRLDPLGTFFFVPSIVSLLIALQWGGSTYAWSNWRIIVLFGLFGILFIAFAAVQVFMPKTATVPVRIIRRRSIMAATIFMFALAGSFLMVIYYLPLWFQVVKGATATQSGIYTLPFVLSLVVASTLSGAFTQKVGYYVPAMIASPSLLATGQGLMSTFRVNEPSSHWIGFQVIAGFGLGLGLQASSLAAQAVLPIPDVPIGIAIMFFAQQLGRRYLHLRRAKSSEHLSSLPSAYSGSFGRSNYERRCAMGVALVAVVAALFMEWKNVKKIGQPGGKPPGPADARAQSPDDIGSEESRGPFIDSSPKLSSDSHSNLNRTHEKAGINGAIDDAEEIRTSPPSKPRPGCEHCEHCRLSRALTLAPSERQSLPHPAHTPSNRHSRPQPLTHPANTPSAEALEEAARLASIAREAVAQLEELTRPFSVIGNPTSRHSLEGAPTRPERAYVPQNSRMRRSSAAPELPSHKARREPTTQELVENARRVSAQLEREDREQARQREELKERQETATRRSDQYSRQLSATTSSPSSQSSAFLPSGTR
ncbi:hypothetical protein CHU98_g259 [Xylaria longipes]|nr:hypothetical protein CHU98_g259 [Xylaria longipes]